MSRACPLVLAAAVLVAAPEALARAQPPVVTVASVEMAILGGAEPRESARRGLAVAVSAAGERVIVGSFCNGARIFTRHGDAWWLEYVWDGSDRGALRLPDEGAVSVALSGDGSRALVGSPLSGNGRAYVLVRSGSTWTEGTILENTDGGRRDAYGSSVALSADGMYAAVGAPNDDTAAGDDAGTVRVYVWTSRGWELDGTLEAPDGARRDAFGTAVALSADGSVALVGAPGRDGGGGNDAGSAYVYARSAGGWAFVAALRAGDAAAGDRLGAAVALAGDGTRALVGAPRDEVSGRRGAGSVRSFSASTVGWAEGSPIVARSRAGDGIPPGQFGSAVALSADGTRALVGAEADEATRARVYVLDGGAWTHVATFWGDGVALAHHFGASAALSSDGRTAVVGAPSDELAGYVASGSARLFALSADDGSGLPEPPRLLDEDERAALSHVRAERVAGARLERVLVQALVSVPVLAGGAALATFMILLASSESETGFAALGRALGLVFGSVLGGLGTAALLTLTVTGVGEVEGGRGSFGGALAGFVVGAVLGVGVSAGAYGIARSGGLARDEQTAVLATGCSLGVLFAGAGAITGYALLDAREQAQADEIRLTPIASAGPDGATLGLAGTF